VSRSGNKRLHYPEASQNIDDDGADDISIKHRKAVSDYRRQMCHQRVVMIAFLTGIRKSNSTTQMGSTDLGLCPKWLRGCPGNKSNKRSVSRYPAFHDVYDNLEASFNVFRNCTVTAPITFFGVSPSY
jgi:hypothetical protein